MEYRSVEEARKAPGLRLVLSMGVPGPWGEAAKGFFHLKGIPFVPVGQKPAVPNPELDAWTGCHNAPVAMYEDERPRSGWAEILLLAERLAPEPRLIPEDPSERALVFGLAHEICGEEGFGWARRLMLLHGLVRPEVPEVARSMAEYMGRKYGLTPETGEAAPQRTAEILRLFSERLLAQRERGSRFFVGDALSAVDIYWATFATLIDPLPHELCPMPKGIRGSYLLTDPDVRKAADPILIEHRDFMYREYLTLPLDF
jgi:glutathione S-transferase